MNKKLFVSDFDGTITEKDFFLIYIDQFVGDEGRQYLEEYRAKKNPSYQFLNNIFSLKTLSQAQYRQILMEMKWDAYFPQFLEDLKEMRIEHLILSAGVHFYVKDALALKGLPEQRVISNDGYFKDGKIQLQHDKSSPYFSELYGIDKGAVIRELRKEYDYIYFAGDSNYVDLFAAEESDKVFATKALSKHYQGDASGKVIHFESYKQISDYLMQNQ